MTSSPRRRQGALDDSHDSELILVKSDEDMLQAVLTLKRQSGANIVFHGGVRTAHALVRLNLIDEYQILVPPMALGAGEPLFGTLPDRMKLELVHARELHGGGVFLRYWPTRRA
jgi:dihydrofolate reductase